MMTHVMTLWFGFWIASLFLGVIGASLGMFHLSNPDAWKNLVLSLAGTCGTIATFLAAKWQNPGKDGNAPPDKPPGASGVIPALLPLLFIHVLLISSCGYCRLPEKVAEPRCVLERNLIACGQQTGYQLLPAVLSLVGQAIAGHFDSDKLVADLEALGIGNAPCVLGAFEAYILPSDPRVAGILHDGLKLALVKKGYHGQVDIRLKSGKIIGVVVP